MRCYCKITTHLIQRPPCYQRGSPHQDPAGNWTTRRPPDHCKVTQTAVVWSCLPFIRSGQNHFTRHSWRGKKIRQTEEKVWRQHQGVDRPGVHQVPEGSGEQGKNGGNWLWNYLWCANNLRSWGVDGMGWEANVTTRHWHCDPVACRCDLMPYPLWPDPVALILLSNPVTLLCHCDITLDLSCPTVCGTILSILTFRTLLPDPVFVTFITLLLDPVTDLFNHLAWPCQCDLSNPVAWPFHCNLIS